MSTQPIEFERGWLLVDMDSGAVMNPYYYPTAADAMNESNNDPSWKPWNVSNNLRSILLGTNEWVNTHIEMLRDVVNDWMVNQLAAGDSQLMDIYNVGSILNEMDTVYGGGKNEYGKYIEPDNRHAIWAPGVPNEPYLLTYINNYMK
jgi:hypothetical protein